VRMRMLTLLVMAAVLATSPAWAQGESPGSGEEEECRAGALCGPSEGEDPFGDTNRSAVDPPGNQVRSLITIGLIFAVLGTYLFIALTGRSPFRRRSG
jgi:hypothetical protein